MTVRLRTFSLPQAPSDVVRVQDRHGNLWTFDPREVESGIKDPQPWRAENPAEAIKAVGRDWIDLDKWSARCSWHFLCDDVWGPVTEVPQ